MHRRCFLSLAATGGAIVASGQAGGSGPQTGTPAAGPTRDLPPLNRRIIRVGCTRADRTSRFAVDELVRCLHAMSGATVVPIADRQFKAAPNTLWLGCLEDWPAVAAPAVSDPARDDVVWIQVDAGQGIVAGSNPRALLIAVYRYLGELGWRWVRPGRENEQFPTTPDPLARDVRVVEKAAARHRGISIEGACSSEHVTDMVDWLPKVGMNTGMIEYTNSFIYYNNWYSQRQDPARSRALMADESASELADYAVDEMKKRGLLVHRMGHGWTCFVLGIPSELWDEPIQRDFGDLTRFIARCEGRRQLFRGIPRRTHLCYSQAEVRTRLVREVVKYAGEHPDVDYVHFWLADGANHCCECDDCRRARPADWYVMILNEIDRQLTEQQLPARIVFLAYADLLWPPEKEAIRNPDRFLLMFATLARSYFEPFHPAGLREPIPPFVLNQLKFPPSQNLNFLAGWQKVFPGDSFIYDYRFMWAQYDDPGYMQLAAAAAEDMPSLAAVGLNGLISDQSERVFLPSGWPMTTMAQFLWRHDLNYEQLAADYFAATFGREGSEARRYLDTLSRLFDPRWLATFVPGKGTLPPGSVQRIEQSRAVPAGTSQRLEQGRRAIADFRPVIDRNKSVANPVQARSWSYLALHADICDQMAQALGLEVQEKLPEATRVWQKLEQFVNAREAECHRAFDVFLFLVSLRKRRAFNALPAHQLEN